MQQTRLADCPGTRVAILMAAVTVMGVVCANAQPETGTTTPLPVAHSDVPPPAQAAPRGGPVVTNLSELRARLRDGDLVVVAERNGDEWRGQVTRIGASDLELVTEWSGGKDAPPRLKVTIPYEVIAGLQRRRDSITNGTLIGAGIGAGVVLGMFAYMAAVDGNEMDEWGGPLATSGAIAAGIGALVGLGIDAALSRPTFVYRPEGRDSTRVSIGPMLSRNAIGLGVSVSY